MYKIINSFGFFHVEGTGRKRNRIGMGSKHLKFLQFHFLDFTNLCPEIIVPMKTDKIKV